MGIHAPKRRAKRALATAASSIAIFGATAPLALAQAPSSAAQFQNITISAGPLSRSLLAVSEAYGVPIVAPNALVAGLDAPEVAGAETAADALRLLLNGSGLSANPTDNGGFVIVRQTTEASVSPTRQQAEVDDTIIVTGTKRGLSLQDTQTSVTVVTGEQAEERALFNLEDIILRAPNLSTGGSSLNGISIRGISFGGVGGAGNGVTGNIYVDGAPSSFSANRGALNLWDVEQVEALRGPQSTVQGRNALAGAIIFQTADPEYGFGVKARVLIGNENSRQYSGAITGPIIADQVAFRLSADYREVDFEVVNQLNGTNTWFQDGLTLRGKLLFEPNALEGLRLELTGEYTESDIASANVVQAPVPISDPAFGDFDPFGNETFAPGTTFSTIQTTRFIADLDYQLSDHWSVKILGTYEEGDSNNALGVNRDINVAETYTAELRANFDYDRLTGWFGGYFFDIGADTTRLTISPVPGLPVIPADTVLNSAIDVTTLARNYAVFGDVTFELTDKLKINLAARYDWENLDVSEPTGTLTSDPPDCIIAPFVPGLGGRPCVEPFLGILFSGDALDTMFEAFLPRGSIIYDFDDYRSVSFSISRGYRAGGVFVTGDSSGGTIIGRYDPEFLTNYEFAFRSEWPDVGVTVNANVFYSDWTDQQVNLPGIAGNLFDRLILNAGESELYGAEFSTEAKVTNKLTLFANMGLLWTEFTDFPFAVDANGDPVNPGDPQFANLDGNSFDNSPRFNAAAGLSYQNDKGLFANTNISYSSAQFSDILNLPENRGDRFFLVNARVGYDFGNYSVAAFVDNLLDDRGALGRNAVGVAPSIGVVQESPNPSFTVNEPRLWGVEARFSY
ncbi:MAG: TonB-dependent receptor [Pseudomonadota bacterium]